MLCKAAKFTTANGLPSANNPDCESNREPLRGLQEYLGNIKL